MGFWARVTALLAVAGTGLAVVSGAAGWDTAHRVLAALALPPLAALVAIGVGRGASPAGAVDRRARAVRAGRAAHRARRAPRPRIAGARRHRRTSLLVSFRGARRRPRAVARLRHAHEAAHHVAAPPDGWLPVPSSARGGVPWFSVFALTMVGLALACGGASALNHYLRPRHRQADGVAHGDRPVASGRVPAPRALRVRARARRRSRSCCSTRSSTSPTALLALAGNLFYVIVYTRFLKRSTAQNIVIGGAAGAVPPLVGFAGASGPPRAARRSFMFAIVFVWTPPHFWALALMIKEHYANAGVPMLPVTRGDRETARQIVSTRSC